ncbi:glycosyltransferase family 4 protein [Rhodopirellula europaea]|uniref:Glycosyl transferase group 1 n=1 Tax=Rhodopirellula europaea 6C TaxID=1263867 RepID=M2B0C9_9BACT|nr:glycosyltransferase family 4 protein [Rhodopirellula europaea]EMB15679.1 glycosyl transferase group 1 [Rhodopirellula europaea 6C]
MKALIDESRSPLPLSQTAYDQQLKVLHVCETAKGGIATYLRIMRASTSERYEHYVVLPEHHAGELQGTLKTTTFNSKKRSILRLGRMLVTARQVAITEKPDILFFHSTFSLTAMLFFCLFLPRRPTIYCPHGWAAMQFAPGSMRRKLIAFAEHHLSKVADAVVNISAYEQRYCEANYPKVNGILIENAVEPCDEKPLPSIVHTSPTQLNILFVGRLDRQKGFDLLFRAFCEATKARTDLHLHVVGDFVLGKSQFTAQVAQSSDVTMHGWKTPREVRSFLDACDILAVPSRWEGFGLVVAESFRSGTPVLASDRCALPDLVSPDETGWVVPFEQVNWTDAIVRLEKHTLRKMRDRCLETYENRFHASRFGHEFDCLFQKMIECKCSCPTS